MNQVLTLDPGGRPSRWASWEDAIVYKVKGLISWSLGDEVAYRGGHCRATGEASIVMVPNIIAVTNEVLDGRVALNNQNLFHRDGHRCGYCGGKFHRGDLTREHIIPVSRGGQDVWTNCIAACKRCNNAKGSRLLDECGYQLLWVPFVPNKAEELILSGRSIKPDQREYLRSSLPKNSPLLQRLVS